MNKYSSTLCTLKRTIEASAIRTLQDCEDEFDPFSCAADVCTKQTSTESTTPKEDTSTKQENFQIDDFFKSISANTSDKDPNAELCGWTTCQFPHRTALSHGFQERLRPDDPEKSTLKPTITERKPAKPPKTHNSVITRHTNPPISSIGRSPESETCIKDLMKEKEQAQKGQSIQSAPPSGGGYFSKAESDHAQQNFDNIKIKPKVFSSHATGYRPKLHQFRHIFGLEPEEPFIHDMSPSYYIDLYRNTKNERRGQSIHFMQSVLKTQTLRSLSVKHAYLQHGTRSVITHGSPVRINNVKFQEPAARQGTPLYYDSSYYEIEDFTDIDNTPLPPPSSPDGSRSKQDGCVDVCLKPKTTALDSLYLSGRSRRTADMPTGLHKANLPKPEHKNTWKKKASSYQAKGVGAAAFFRPGSSSERNKTNATKSVKTSRTGPTIPTGVQAFDGPSSVVAPVYYVSKHRN